MSMLSCPQCGLVIPVARGELETEVCPRCLGRSGGALSVSLTPMRSRDSEQHSGILARLMGGLRHAVASP
jgi:Zn-finger nucleic acid-binding protein